MLDKFSKMDEEDIEDFITDNAFPERKDGKPQGWWSLSMKYDVNKASRAVDKYLTEKMTPLIEKHESSDSDSEKKKIMKDLKPYFDARKTGNPSKLPLADQKKVMSIINKEIDNSKASPEKKEKARGLMDALSKGKNPPKEDPTGHFDPNFTHWAEQNPWSNPNKDGAKKTITWNTLRKQYPEEAKKHYQDWQRKKAGNFQMSDLRKKLIRLAHAKPEFRKDILPLLKEASGVTLF